METHFYNLLNLKVAAKDVLNAFGLDCNIVIYVYLFFARQSHPSG